MMIIKMVLLLLLVVLLLPPDGQAQGRVEEVVPPGIVGIVVFNV